MSSSSQQSPHVAPWRMPHRPAAKQMPRPSTVIEDITIKELQLIRIMKDHAESCRIMQNHNQVNVSIGTQSHTTAQRGRQDRSRSPVSGSSSLPDPSSLRNLPIPEPFSASPATEDHILTQGRKASREMWLMYHIGCCEIMSAYTSVVTLKDHSHNNVYREYPHSRAFELLVDVETFRLELEEVVVNDPVQDLRRFRHRYKALLVEFMRIRVYCLRLFEHNP